MPLAEFEINEICVWQLLSGLGAAKLCHPWPLENTDKMFGDLEVEFEATVKLSSKHSTIALMSINSEVKRYE